MPALPVPDDIDALLAQPNYAVIASVRPDGKPHSAVTWYDWEDGRVLLTHDASRLRLQYLRANPDVSLTVIDGTDFLRHVTVTGRVDEIYEDGDFSDANRMAQRYFGTQYPDQERPRVSAWFTVETWHSWDGLSRAPIEERRERDVEL